jgi:hypothetical protein
MLQGESFLLLLTSGVPGIMWLMALLLQSHNLCLCVHVSLFKRTLVIAAGPTLNRIRLLGLYLTYFNRGLNLLQMPVPFEPCSQSFCLYFVFETGSH